MSSVFWDGAAKKPLSVLDLRFVPLDFVMHWHRCGLTADYVAAHMAYAFENRDPARTVLSTVVNELVENAVKFSCDKAHEARLLVRHYGDVLCIEAHNRTDTRRADVLRGVLSELERRSAEELFLERVTAGASPGASASGLGLIVLKKDYGARLNMRSDVADEDLLDVTVQVLVDTEEVERG